MFCVKLGVVTSVATLQSWEHIRKYHVEQGSVTPLNDTIRHANSAINQKLPGKRIEFSSMFYI